MYPLTNHRNICIACLLYIFSLVALTTQAQVTTSLHEGYPLPTFVQSWLQSPGLCHATTVLEVARLPQTYAPLETDSVVHPAIERGKILYSYEAERLVAPASVLKLLSSAAALRLLGANYVWPDSLPMADTTGVRLPGLEHYNPDWLIEDIDTDYMTGLVDPQEHAGLSLQEVMHETLVKSLNIEAETMMRMIDPTHRLDSSLITLARYWQTRGLDSEGSLRLYDGCGLSPNDRVTAHFIISLLADMQFNDTFRKALPAAGKEGTVVNFLRGTRLEGHVRLKSGSLKNVVSYAGYAEGTDKKTYAFCLIVNNATCRPYEVRRGMEQILLKLIP